jgi:hypothetical protein
MAIKVIYSHGIKVFYAGVVFESLWYFENEKLKEVPLVFIISPKRTSLNFWTMDIDIGHIK